MNPSGLVSVGIGSALGGWLRWWLGTRMNAIFPTIPLGTLASNIIAGYIIGIALGAVMQNAIFPANLRLFVMTGFCGGLSTFSTFSAEVFTLFARGQAAWAFGEIAIHVGTSLAATALGYFSFALLRYAALGGAT